VLLAGTRKQGTIKGSCSSHHPRPRMHGHANAWWVPQLRALCALHSQPPPTPCNTPPVAECASKYGRHVECFFLMRLYLSEKRRWTCSAACAGQRLASTQRWCHPDRVADLQPFVDVNKNLLLLAFPGEPPHACTTALCIAYIWRRRDEGGRLGTLAQAGSTRVRLVKVWCCRRVAPAAACTYT